MRLQVPGQDVSFVFERDRFGCGYEDGTEDMTPITDTMRAKAADRVAIGGSIASGAAGWGIGSAIASLGSIGIAGLGTAISIPLFPVIGGAAAIAAAGAGIVAVTKAADAIEHP